MASYRHLVFRRVNCIHKHPKNVTQSAVNACRSLSHCCQKHICYFWDTDPLFLFNMSSHLKIFLCYVDTRSDLTDVKYPMRMLCVVVLSHLLTLCEDLHASSPLLPCTLSSAVAGQPGALKENMDTRSTTQTHSGCILEKM